MALQDRLLHQARTALPGATDEAITAELWEVLTDLCRDAWVWRETVEIPLVAGDADYPVGVTGADVVHVFNVYHPTMDTSGVLYEFGTLTISNTMPTAADVAAGAMYIVVALTPTLAPGSDVEGWIPSDLWPLLHQTLLAGVQYRMMSHPAKPYSNPVLATARWREYKGLKATERQRAATGNRPGAQRWRFPPFAVPSIRK